MKIEKEEQVVDLRICAASNVRKFTSCFAEQQFEYGKKFQQFNNCFLLSLSPLLADQYNLQTQMGIILNVTTWNFKCHRKCCFVARISCYLTEHFSASAPQPDTLEIRPSNISPPPQLAVD